VSPNRAAALGAFLAVLAACTGLPAVKAPEAAPRPSAPAIVDAASADLVHKVEGQKIEEALQRRLGEIQAEQARFQRQIESWAYGAGMAMAVAGIALFALSFWLTWLRPLGGVLAVAGVLVLVFARAVIAYGDSMAAIVAIGLAVALAGGMVWLLLKLRAAVKAQRELVATGEEAKQEMPPDGRARVFGAGGFADSIQSPTTKRVVQKIRTKLERSPK
jgi:hypothetical protein